MRLAVLVAIWAVLGMLPDVRAQERPAPRFDRGGTAQRRPVSPPSIRPPSELATSEPTERRRSSIPEEAGARAVRPDRDRPAPSDEEVERRGLAAGAGEFDDRARPEGWRNLYWAGAFEGQRTAVNDPSLGRADYEQGLRLGRLDPGAREFGASEGTRAAEQAASADAPAQAERQFLDLSWTPVASPRPKDARFEGRFQASPEPELDEVFRDYPITRVPYLPRRMNEAFAGGRWSPASLHRTGSWDQVVDGRWRDGARAFGRFTSDPERSRFFRSLQSPPQRALFEASFLDGFDERLSAAYPALVRDAWSSGFDDGWSYGAVVRAEWSFRQGYVAGFDAGLAFAADVAFERTYAAAYDLAYRDAFHDWMGSAHPRLLSARLRDADDDGIFRPGEEVNAEFALANYGGVGASYRVELEGAPLRSGASIEIRMPARRRLDPTLPLTAALSPGIRTPSNQTLVLRLAQDRLDLPLRVSYPMEFTGTVSYESDPLEGRGAVRFEVVNRSRKPQDPVAVVTQGMATAASPQRIVIGRVAPGATAEAGFALDGVRPLELLGGTLVVSAALQVDDEVHDRKAVRFPELATRLDHPDLVTYLVHLGGATEVNVEEIAGTRRLLMQRLEADWNARGREKGNAYESDLRDGGARTALGELVRELRGAPSDVRDSLVVHGLDDEVAALAERLDGVHPNLRRSMKKLARRLAS